MTDTIDAQFLGLFNGKEQIGGSQQAYLQIREFLNQGAATRKMVTCLIFYEKPVQFLATGRTRAGSGDGIAVNGDLLRYLPQHDDENAYRERTEAKFGLFRKVNFTMVRRIALLALEYDRLPRDMLRSWEAAYGGKPRTLDFSIGRWTQMDEETRRIKREGINRFRSEHIWWNGFFTNEA
jgi:hypothetical protein